MTIDELLKLRKQAESLRQQADRADGAKVQILRELKEKFKVGSAKEAKELLKELEKEETAAEKEYQRKLGDFEKEWKDRL